MKSAWHVNREIKTEAKQVSNFILFLADFDVFFQTPVQRKSWPQLFKERITLSNG